MIKSSFRFFSVCCGLFVSGSCWGQSLTKSSQLGAFGLTPYRYVRTEVSAQETLPGSGFGIFLGQYLGSRHWRLSIDTLENKSQLGNLKIENQLRRSGLEGSYQFKIAVEPQYSFLFSVGAELFVVSQTVTSQVGSASPTKDRVVDQWGLAPVLRAHYRQAINNDFLLEVGLTAKSSFRLSSSRTKDYEGSLQLGILKPF